MPTQDAKKKLLFLWTLFVFINMGALIFATINGKYANFANEAWNWYCYTFLAFYSVVVGISIKPSEKSVSKSLFRMVWWCSFLYLLVASSGFFLSPLAWELGGIAPIQLMKLSGAWLTPLTIIVGLVLGSLILDN